MANKFNVFYGKPPGGSGGARKKAPPVNAQHRDFLLLRQHELSIGDGDGETMDEPINIGQAITFIGPDDEKRINLMWAHVRQFGSLSPRDEKLPRMVDNLNFVYKTKKLGRNQFFIGSGNNSRTDSMYTISTGRYGLDPFSMLSLLFCISIDFTVVIEAKLNAVKLFQHLKQHYPILYMTFILHNGKRLIL